MYCVNEGTLIFLKTRNRQPYVALGISKKMWGMDSLSLRFREDCIAAKSMGKIGGRA